jgi:hypothetical protein
MAFPSVTPTHHSNRTQLSATNSNPTTQLAIFLHLVLPLNAMTTFIITSWTTYFHNTGGEVTSNRSSSVFAQLVAKTA